MPKRSLVAIVFTAGAAALVMWIGSLAGCAQPAADPHARADTPPSQKDRPTAVMLLTTSPYKEA